MIKRAIERILKNRLELYPAVALDGPRQSGKTTLARILGGLYFDLEQEADKTRLDIQWPEIIRGEDLIVLDEAQQHPEVFRLVRGAIDQDRHRSGRFLLLGSVSPALKSNAAESLAGRLALVELTPILFSELSEEPIADMWLRGGFPEGSVVHPDRFPQWHRDYLNLLTQRDLPNWGLPAKPAVTGRLLQMTASVHGQPWNASQIGQGLGLSHPTVNTYMDYLEGAFLIRRLPPFTANLKKRVVKSPRVYWRDPGLLHALHRTSDFETLLGRPWVGASWEGFVIEQILGALQHLDRRVDPSFFRTSDGTEIDLVLDFERERWAVEIKLTTQPSPHDIQKLSKAANLVDAQKRFLLTQTPDSVTGRDVTSCDLRTFLRELAA